MGVQWWIYRRLSLCPSLTEAGVLPHTDDRQIHIRQCVLCNSLVLAEAAGQTELTGQRGR